MKKIFCPAILVLFLCIVQVTPITAQEWSFGGELGATLFSFFEYNPVYQDGASFERGYTIPHNEGWVLSYYPSNRKSFFSLGYTQFNQRNADILVRHESGSVPRQIATAPFNRTISVNMGYQLDISDYLSLNQGSLFFEPIYGLGIEWLIRGRPYPEIGLISLVDYSRKKGINPSLQAGFRFSYRHRRSKFSIKALGNLGFRYRSEIQYRILLPEEPILATIRSKNDFLAAQVSYEYIFKSDKVEKKTRKQDRISIFSRAKIQELKTGFHPVGFNRNLSLNYELFPTKQDKSLFLDLSYYNTQSNIEMNISEDENNPEYISSTYRLPFLDVRIGRNIFSKKETGEKWGVGYYLRADTRLAKNRKYVEAFEESFGETPNTSYYYAALGANLQYKWLIKDRWSITPMVLADLGVGSESSYRTKYRVFLEPLFFDVQARLYIGYRF